MLPYSNCNINTLNCTFLKNNTATRPAFMDPVVNNWLGKSLWCSFFVYSVERMNMGWMSIQALQKTARKYRQHFFSKRKAFGMRIVSHITNVVRLCSVGACNTRVIKCGSQLKAKRRVCWIGEEQRSNKPKTWIWSWGKVPGYCGACRWQLHVYRTINLCFESLLTSVSSQRP